MRRAIRRTTWLLATLVVVTAAATVAFGMPFRQSLLLDALVAGVVGLILLRPRVDEGGWRPAELAVGAEQGARREVARLSWTVGEGRTRTVARPTVARLQVVAARRLDRLGLDLSDPVDRAAIIERVGPVAFSVLDPGHDREIGLDAFATAVGAVELLDD